jgi:ribonuclease P protein component
LQHDGELTHLDALSTLCRFDNLGGNTVHEADVSAECATTEENSRLPPADEDQGRAEGAQASAREGAETADRLTGRFPRRERLTTSADFQALFQRGKRIDRPSMIVLWYATAEPRRAGFAVSRQIRGAVQRNRARRRLREAYRAMRNAAPIHTALVIIGRPAALRKPFAALAGELHEALTTIPGPRS